MYAGFKEFLSLHDYLRYSKSISTENVFLFKINWSQNNGTTLIDDGV